MAKTKSNRCGGNIRGTWSNADHDARTAKRLASLNKKRQRQAQQHRQSTGDDDNDDIDSTRRLRPTHDNDNEQPLHRIRLKRKAGRDANHRLSAHVPDNVYKRTHLAHDDLESSRLRLVTSRLQRKVDDLRAQLEDWDPTEHHSLLLLDLEDGKKSSSSSSSSDVAQRMELDAHNRQMDRVARQLASSEHTLLQAQHGVNSSLYRRKNNLRKKPRPGPESWKLRGAARPAYEVYDFDTRHVDVHRLALDAANARARRVVNVMKVCRGRFAMDFVDNTHQDDTDTAGETKTPTSFVPPQPYCRKYLSLLTQLGSIHLHRKNYSSARKYFLEAIDLEGYDHPASITNARYRLMNMYLTRNQPNSARRLWERLHTDTSAWIRYSAALIDYVSWNILHEKGSTANIAEMSLVRAIRGNAFVAYFLGWSSIFEKAMEYTNEVVESGIMVGKDSGSLLEAIEYACRCYSTSTSGDDHDDDDKDVGMAMWLGTEGSLDWVRSVVLRVLHESNGINNNELISLDSYRLTKTDLRCWENQLQREEQDFEKERKEKKDLTSTDVGENAGLDEDVSGEGDDDEEKPDVLMYAGMFRTSMDLLEDAGEFLKEPSFAYVTTMAETDEGSGAVSGDDDHENEDMTGDMGIGDDGDSC